jgi:hypothetical protein
MPQKWNKWDQEQNAAALDPQDSGEEREMADDEEDFDEDDDRDSDEADEEDVDEE